MTSTIAPRASGTLHIHTADSAAPRSTLEIAEAFLASVRERRRGLPPQAITPECSAMESLLEAVIRGDTGALERFDLGPRRLHAPVRRRVKSGRRSPKVPNAPGILGPALAQALRASPRPEARS